IRIYQVATETGTVHPAAHPINKGADMIVKILKPSTTFKGVRYNTNKVDKDKGELMKVANFGALQALQNLRPTDYVNYLEAQSAASKRTKYPQLHAVISCKGRS